MSFGNRLLEFTTEAVRVLDGRLELPRRSEPRRGAGARKWSGSAQWSELVAYDQLLQERRDGRAFAGFCESAITSRPVCRPNKDVYENAKQRVPSWCDRVLWRAHPSYAVEPQAYDYAPAIMTSDHRPVQHRSCGFRWRGRCSSPRCCSSSCLT